MKVGEKERKKYKGKEKNTKAKERKKKVGVKERKKYENKERKI